MEESVEDSSVTVLDVFEVDLCVRVILDYVPLRELVRSERVCRRWQQLLRNYLRRCRHTDLLYQVYYFYLKSFRQGCHSDYVISRQKNMYFAHQSLLSAYEALVKFGPPEEKESDRYFKYFASDCPYLRHLKSQNLYEEINRIQNRKKLKISELIIHKRKSAFSVAKSDLYLTGDLKLIKSKNLTLETLCYVIYTLRNVTTLELDDHNLIKRDYVCFLLNAMPQLQNLYFSNYTTKYTSILYNDPYTRVHTEKVSNDQMIKLISGLVNLKRLHMRNNTIVNDRLLEALAQKCRKLKYLDIANDSTHGHREMDSARGVVSLCRRMPSATTTLCLGYVENISPPALETYLQGMPIVQDLQSLGCVELTSQWFEETSRASATRSQPLELRVEDCWLNACQLPQTDELDNLKIVLSTDVHTEQKFADLSL